MVKLKGFTILETMIAMLIIMVIFGFTTSIFLNISSSGYTHQKHIAYTLVKKLRNETLRDNRYIDETLEVKDIIIEKRIKDYESQELLKTLHVSAFHQDVKLYESKDLIILE